MPTFAQSSDDLFKISVARYYASLKVVYLVGALFVLPHGSTRTSFQGSTSISFMPDTNRLLALAASSLIGERDWSAFAIAPLI
jgi:hypothetical protein